MYHRNSGLQIWFWCFCAGKTITRCTHTPKWLKNQFVRPLTTGGQARWEHTGFIPVLKYICQICEDWNYLHSPVISGYNLWQVNLVKKKQWFMVSVPGFNTCDNWWLLYLFIYLFHLTRLCSLCLLYVLTPQIVDWFKPDATSPVACLKTAYCHFKTSLKHQLLAALMHRLAACLQTYFGQTRSDSSLVELKDFPIPEFPGMQACRHLCSIKMLIISSAISSAILL